jgi:hypothetical protein
MSPQLAISEANCASQRSSPHNRSRQRLAAFGFCLMIQGSLRKACSGEDGMVGSRRLGRRRDGITPNFHRTRLARKAPVHCSSIERWLEENKAAIDAYNLRVSRDGLLADEAGLL